MEDDIIIDYDVASKRFLLTGKTDRGREWLDEYATSDMEWWGKSLILLDVNDVIERLDRAGLTSYLR